MAIVAMVAAAMAISVRVLLKLSSSVRAGQRDLDTASGPTEK